MTASLPTLPLATTREIIADFKAGKMVILVDEEDRENEGDLVLAADQRELAAAFATASIDKFADVPFGIGLRGYPILHGSIAVFECQTENTVEGGDHLIFIGRVVAASYCDGEPLVFSRGEYCVPVRHAPPPEPQCLHV